MSGRAEKFLTQDLDRGRWFLGFVMGLFVGGAIALVACMGVVAVMF